MVRYIDSVTEGDEMKEEKRTLQSAKSKNDANAEMKIFWRDFTHW